MISIVSTIFLAACIPSLVFADAFSGDDCVEPCISEMQMVMESTPFGRTEQHGQLSWTQLLHASQNRQMTENSFKSICQAYQRVDKCLEKCEQRSDQSASIRQTYAGLRFICIERQNEFFSNLPCLAQYESVAMSRCQQEINESLIGSNAFSEAVMNREHHSIRNRFSSLCKGLENMIKCIEPVTRSGCGEDATKMMLRFITIGFASFEQLYSHLGITDQLPESCRDLLSLTASNFGNGAETEHQESAEHLQFNDAPLSNNFSLSANLLLFCSLTMLFSLIY